MPMLCSHLFSRSKRPDAELDIERTSAGTSGSLRLLWLKRREVVALEFYVLDHALGGGDAKCEFLE